jgi:hypothetical protein
MNFLSLGLAALGGMLANIAFGVGVMVLAPSLFAEAHKYPAVFRPKEEMMAYMPMAMGGTFLAVLVAAIIFAISPRAGSAAVQGAGLGALLGVLAVCNVVHNYANTNIGAKLALGQSAAYLLQWTVVGVAIGLIYRPLSS